MRVANLSLIPLVALTLLLNGCGEEAEKKRLEAMRSAVAEQVSAAESRLRDEFNARMRSEVDAGIKKWVEEERARRAAAQPQPPVRPGTTVTPPRTGATTPPRTGTATPPRNGTRTNPTR